MTIAITAFDGLCGFRPLAEIEHFLASVSPLRKLVGEDQAQEFESAIKGKDTSDEPEEMKKNKGALRSVFSSLMRAEKDAIASAADELVQSAKSAGSSFAGNGERSDDGQELADLVVKLNNQFPQDIGLFVLFFLNHVKLEPGEAMFLKADDIHAYLSGGESSPQ